MKKQCQKTLKEKGNLGEILAIKHLQKKGLKLLKKNFHSRFGEIDLIFKDKDFLVFVEVKTRLSNLYGNPEEAINKRKINSILKTGQYFQLLNPKTPKALRIDVVGIFLDSQNYKILSLKHFENVTKYM